MPWLSILMALLAWAASDKSTPAARSNALLAAAAVGGGTYAVTHGTDWGQANLGSLDGVVPSAPTLVSGAINGVPYSIPEGSIITTDAQGNIVTDADGNPTYHYPNGSSTGANVVNTAGKVLESWGATGTAAVIGTTALASSGSLTKYAPWLLGLGAIFLLTR